MQWFCFVFLSPCIAYLRNKIEVTSPVKNDEHIISLEGSAASDALKAFVKMNARKKIEN